VSKKILVLDDDPDLLEMMSYLLSDSGYAVETLSGGETVFQSIEAFQPDLVLMDVMLADMDGRKICAAIKENAETSGLPVILISGTHDLAASLQQPGAPNDFVAKPFDIDHLLRRIRIQLGEGLNTAIL
jgi:DNA-binding response OmpR family regulator